MTCRTAHYETFNPRSVAHYSKSACDKMETPWIYDSLSETISGGDFGLDLGADHPDSTLSNMAYIDDDDEYEDTVRWVLLKYSRNFPHRLLSVINLVGYAIF